MVDLILTGGKIATSFGVYEAGVAVHEGKIVSIAKDQNLPNAEKTINVKGNIILPGVIDGHVHMWDPGAPRREDFESGTRVSRSRSSFPGELRKSRPAWLTQSWISPRPARVWRPTTCGSSIPL